MARRRKGLLYQSLATQQRGAQRRCGGGGYGRDAAVKFPPAGQAATAASLRTDFTHTLRQSVRPSGSHARTHTLSQATSSAAAPFLHLHRCCLPPSPRLPAHSPRRRRRRPRQLFHSSPSLSPSYLRVAIPSPPASQPASLCAIYVTRPATDTVTCSAFHFHGLRAATEGLSPSLPLQPPLLDSPPSLTASLVPSLIVKKKLLRRLPSLKSPLARAAPGSCPHCLFSSLSRSSRLPRIRRSCMHAWQRR